MTPIVIHHGLFGRGHWHVGPWHWSYFKGIDRAILRRGYPVIIPTVHPTAGVITRARQLKAVILARLNEMNRRSEKVVIIAHSLGGLDARYMISHLAMADQIKALVTISTPHRGSPIADWCVRHIGEELGALRFMKLIRWDMQAAIDLTRDSCRIFNEETPDNPGVKYYSVSVQRPIELMPVFARHSHRLIQLEEGPNDGLVSVASAQWGQHLGTWSADHWLAINRRLVAQAGRSDRIIGHWMEILDRLAADGVIEPAGELAKGNQEK
ncbi:MAG: alpha/beta fold hydrolase [Tepidisphaeraceae bacterium]